MTEERIGAREEVEEERESGWGESSLNN